jgi:regulator of RNase E activity RraA
MFANTCGMAAKKPLAAGTSVLRLQSGLHHSFHSLQQERRMPTVVHRSTAPRLSTELISQWASVPTSIAADLFRGRTLVDPAIRPLRPFIGRARLAGNAVTAWCESADYGPVHHALAVAEPGDVILVEAGGRLDAAMIGEILGSFARRKGLAGVAVNGAVRDVGTLTQWPDFAVFTRGTTPRGPSTMERGAVNASMVFAGAQVSPCDLVLGDDDGLVVIPRADAEQRIRSALAMVKAEEEWKRGISSGATTVDLFKVPAAAQTEAESSGYAGRS